jgi:hypothetical protein
MLATREELQEPSSRSKVDIKTQQRLAKKTIKFEAEERKRKGLPPQKVEVTKHGKIDGSCDGKNDWDNAMRGLAPCILNMAIVKVGEQNPVDMAELRSQLDNLFENIHHELSACGFRDCVRRFIKSERSRLKKRYQKDGQIRCPLGVDADQWVTFVKYWEEHNTQKKTSQLTGVKGVVTKLSKYGRGGKCRNPTLVKCGREAQHSQSWGLGVLRDSRMFKVRQQGPKHLALGCS